MNGLIFLLIFIYLSFGSAISEVPSVSSPFGSALSPALLVNNFSWFYANCTYGEAQTWAGRTVYIYDNCSTVPVVPVNLYNPTSVYSTSLSTLPSSLSDNVMGLFNVSGTIYLLITRAGASGAMSFDLTRGNSVYIYTCTSCDNRYLLIRQFNSTAPSFSIINSISQTYLDRNQIPGYVYPLSLSVDRTFLNESSYIFYSSLSNRVGTLVFFKHPNYSTALFTDIVHLPGENFFGIFYPGAWLGSLLINRSFAPIYLPMDYLINNTASTFIQFFYTNGFVFVNYQLKNYTINNVIFLEDFQKKGVRPFSIMNITVSNRSALSSSYGENNYTVYEYSSTITFRLNTSLFPYSEITVPVEHLARPVSASCASVTDSRPYNAFIGYVQMCNLGTSVPSYKQGIYKYTGRQSIIHLPGIMEIASVSNSSFPLGTIGNKKYYINFSSPVDCVKHKTILYYESKDIFYGSLYDYEVLTRSIDRIYLDYRPVSGIVYIKFPTINKTITNYELQNYLVMFPSFSVLNYVPFGDHICNFTIANISAELPLFSNISGVNRSNFFNIGEPTYMFSDGAGNYSCRYVSGTLYCFSGQISSELGQYVPYFNTSYIPSGLIDVISKAEYLRCIINRYNDSHKSLKFVGLFKVPLNFTIIIRNSSGIDSIYNYTNVSNISATLYFRSNQKAEILSDSVPICKSYGFFDDLSNLPAAYPFFALIIIGLATVAVTNILSLIGVSYLLIEGGLFLGVSVNVIAFVIGLFFAIYLLINKPTEDSVRTAVTLGLALFFALNELVRTVPEVYDIDNTYFSSVSDKIANKTASLQELVNGGWDSLEMVSLPGVVVGVLLIPFDIIFGLPLLLRDIINAFWFPVGYYIGSLGTILVTLVIINLVLRIIEILLNRFRKL